MSVSISQLSFEHHRTAFGIAETRPRISWRFEGNAANWTQSGYSLEVSRQGQSQPDIFHANSSDSVLVPWPTVALSSRESASVRVKAFGQEGQPRTEWSDAFTVETGLLSQDDWLETMMIGSEAASDVDEPKRPVLLRKEFDVNDQVASARLYITSYGIYEAHINGKRVGDAVLAPGWQSYKYRHVYDTYDVTDHLQSGENAIGIQVGEGWYAGRLGYGGGQRNLWGDSLGAMALLIYTNADGTEHTVQTNMTWNASSGPFITSEIYDGEQYDSTREQPGWSTAKFKPSDGAKWTGVKELEAPYDQLTSPDGPPIRRTGEVKLQQVLTSPSGKKILDFGQNLVGWLRLNVKGPRGHKIKMVHTEVLEDGEVATRPLRNATQTDSLILSGESQTWEPTFTYHGFRYVEVDNWPEEHTPLGNSSVTAIVIHSDMQETGDFECSDHLLNKLTENVRWSMKGNFLSIPTDCPQRDERLGWLGDAHAFAPTANFLYDTTGFWNGWLKVIARSYLTGQLRPVRVNASLGVPPVVVPWVPAVGSEIMATAVWGDAVVANPWNAYRTSGDKVALKEQYAGAKAWIDTGIPRNEEGLWNRAAFQFGDWLDPLSPPDDPGAATTNSSYVADAYLIYVTDMVADMASELRFDADAKHYRDWAARLRTAFQDAWISTDGHVANETQTGLTLPLYFGLFADDSQSSAAVKRLDDIIAANNFSVGTGFAGTHLLGLALTEYNLTDTFYKMIKKTTSPSWLYQVVMGGTTTWERWDSLLPNGELNPGEMTSFNHYSFGSVANWIYQTVGGLAPAKPGWKTTKIAVIPGGGITQAKASYLSPYGKVSTEWQVSEDGFHLRVVVPPNANAEVTLPQSKDRVERVGSGVHEFSLPDFRM
ncbi:extracellular glycosyl hydrolase family 78 protein [Xylariomycetidae sp. FL0641]|nr:extracellular glycosyl hydrolase family 78 protein [Xylariomycetidae sp. FL0641]